MNSPTRSKTLRTAGALLALAGAAGLTSACGGDAAGAAETAAVVSVLEAGTGDTIKLPVPYAVGQTASTSATFTTSLELDGSGVDETLSFAFRLDQTSTVVDVDAEGGGVVDSRIEAAEWLEQPGELDAELLSGIVGVSYTETIDASGTPVSREIVGAEELSETQRQAADEFVGQSESVAFAFPDEPVAVGATWSSDTTVDSNGFVFPATYSYELVALDAESFMIAVTYDSPVDSQADGVFVSGQISGSGTVTGAVDNPLELAFEFVQDASFSAEQARESIDIQMSVAIESEVTGTDAGADQSLTATTVAG